MIHHSHYMNCLWDEHIPRYWANNVLREMEGYVNQLKYKELENDRPSYFSNQTSSNIPNSFYILTL
jgi:hypothetical protein